MFSWAVNELEIVDRNPGSGLQREENNERTRFLSREELETLLAAVEGDLELSLWSFWE